METPTRVWYGTFQTKQRLSFPVNWEKHQTLFPFLLKRRPRVSWGRGEMEKEVQRKMNKYLTLHSPGSSYKATNYWYQLQQKLSPVINIERCSPYTAAHFHCDVDHICSFISLSKTQTFQPGTRARRKRQWQHRGVKATTGGEAERCGSIEPVVRR